MQFGKWRPDCEEQQERTPYVDRRGVQIGEAERNGRHMLTVDPPIILTWRPDLNAAIFRLVKIFFYKNTVYLVQ